ncbi:MAG TPA: hypothetical protein VII94_03465 [Candidatus Saccharimonadales bacterium]
MRKIKRSDLVGKTIQRISNRSVNVLKLTFSDGTKLELWAEDAISTPMGSIPGIFAEVPKKK